MKFEEVAKGLDSGKFYERGRWLELGLGVFIQKSTETKYILMKPKNGSFTSLSWNPSTEDILAYDWMECAGESREEREVFPRRIDINKTTSGAVHRRYSFPEKVDAVECRVSSAMWALPDALVGVVLGGKQ